MKYTRVVLLAIFACSVWFPSAVDAQSNSDFILSSVRNSDNSVSVYADCRIAGDYTIKCMFSILSGYKISGGSAFRDIVLAPVAQGKREIFKLIPEKGANYYNYEYKYNWFPGRAARIRARDTAFLYLLPGSANKTVVVNLVTKISDLVGKTGPQPEFYATGFGYKLGDTVCASRGGIVSIVNDTMQQGERSSEMFKSGRNSISINHKDGTQGKYEFRAIARMLVAPGDEVIAGQPIAVFEKPSDHLQMMLSVFYLSEQKILSLQSYEIDYNRALFPYAYLHPLFCNDYSGNISTTLLPGSSYITTHPAKIVGAEMSKKEKKKYGIAD